MSHESDRLKRGEFDMVERQRATPLKPAVWMTGVLVWATVVGLMMRVPTWAGVFLCCMTGISFLFYLVSYAYLMVVDPEKLRSERYLGPRVLRVREAERTHVGAVESSSGTATLEAAGQSSESPARLFARGGGAGHSIDGPGGSGARTFQSGEAEPSKAPERAT